MTEIVALERKHHDFYAPTFEIRLNGKNLLRQELVEITQVQVDTTLKDMDRFSFTVNSAFDFERREFVTESGYDQIKKLFAFGGEVLIRMGYKDVRGEKLIHRGMITSVKTGFPSSGLPQITVSGYDLSYCMKYDKKSKPWNDIKDSDIARQLAGKYGLKPFVQDSLVKHPRTEKYQQSDKDFLKMLADRNGFEVFTVEKVLHFHEPDQEQDASIILEWGKGLVSFTPEINIAEQVTDVEVHGWDVATKKPIVGKARVGQEIGRDGGQRSGGEVVQSVCKDETTIKMRFPVRSKQEADRKAKSILKKRSELFVTGSGEAIGTPEIVPNTNIKLLGLGKLFSKTYFVEEATHTISTSGYRTTFKVKETTIEAKGRS